MTTICLHHVTSGINPEVGENENLILNGTLF